MSFVLSSTKMPLMPCTPKKARIPLECNEKKRNQDLRDFMKFFRGINTLVATFVLPVLLIGCVKTKKLAQDSAPNIVGGSVAQPSLFPATVGLVPSDSKGPECGAVKCFYQIFPRVWSL
jgi:hypothetical protein